MNALHQGPVQFKPKTSNHKLTYHTLVCVCVIDMQTGSAAAILNVTNMKYAIYIYICVCVCVCVCVFDIQCADGQCRRYLKTHRALLAPMQRPSCVLTGAAKVEIRFKTQKF